MRQGESGEKTEGCGNEGTYPASRRTRGAWRRGLRPGVSQPQAVTWAAPERRVDFSSCFENVLFFLSHS